jgi:hypothetical protein
MAIGARMSDPLPDPVDESNTLIAECREMQDELNAKLVRLASLGVICNSVCDGKKTDRVRLSFTFQDAP